MSQTGTGTEATGGGAGQNSRLDIKVIEATDGGQYYHLLVHRADGDDGSYTVTVTRLDWPDGRRAPDITVDQENRNNVEISWTKSKKTHNSLVAPPGGGDFATRDLAQRRLKAFNSATYFVSAFCRLQRTFHLAGRFDAGLGRRWVGWCGKVGLVPFCC